MMSKDTATRSRQLDALARNRFALPSGDHNDPRRCTARSKQAGRRCRNLAAKGMSVCRMHGARAGRPRKDGTAPVTRQEDATPARTRVRAQKMERRARSRLRRQGIQALAEMDHSNVDRETLATARGIYAQLLQQKGEPFGNDTMVGAAFSLCVMRATYEIRTLKEFDTQLRRVLGFGIVPTAAEEEAVQQQMAESRAERARGHASASWGAGGW
jgi:hypothetical protein